jgi:hypothetical protein
VLAAAAPEIMSTASRQPGPDSSAASVSFESEREFIDSNGKKPQDCSDASAAAAPSNNRTILDLKSNFDSSDKNIGLCVYDRSKVGEFAGSNKEDWEENASSDSSGDKAKSLPQESDDLELITRSERRNSLEKAFSTPEVHEVSRKKAKRNVRRNTDGGLAKFNLHSATAAASSSIIASIAFDDLRRSRFAHSARPQSVNSLGSQSPETPTFKSRIYGWLNSTYICSPIRQYRKRTSAIPIMENQCFIPPSSDGASFIRTVFNTMRGFGVDFVIWVNQSSFFTALVFFLSTYYAMVCIFAGILLHMEIKTGGKCVDLDEVFTTEKGLYELAFELSWTTFTTVGYGRVSPSAYEYGCYSMRLLCASFAFLGLLFNSLSAAIFFSKLESFLTRSSVTFSSSVCLQHGRAPNTIRTSHYGQFLRRNSSLLEMNDSIASNNKNGSGRKSKSLLDMSSNSFLNGELQVGIDKQTDLVLHIARLSRKMPYPFLEFRIVNEHANYKNREIRNAHVAAIVQLTPADAENSLDRDTSVTDLHREYVTPAPSRLSSPSTDENEGRTSSASGSMDTTTDIKTDARPSSSKFNPSSLQMPVVREDSGTGEQIGPEGRVYIPLTLDPSSHPYFKRVYYVHHVLDYNSPLLKPSVRSKIKNGWDPSLSTYQDIRDSLVEFRRIRIIFKGNSAVNNSMVFAEKIYTPNDLFVGWQFGDIFYKREKWRWRKKAKKSPQGTSQTDVDDDELVLDKRLIHDIFPQKNASSEPLRIEED